MKTDIETTYIENLISDLYIERDFEDNEIELKDYLHENTKIKHPKHGNIALLLSARVRVFGFVIWAENEFWENGREVILDDYEVVDEDGFVISLSKLQYKLIEDKVEEVLSKI